jgi:hypothetical protein
MGALQPWHLAVLGLCALIPVAIAAGVTWAVVRSRRRARQRQGAI